MKKFIFSLSSCSLFYVAWIVLYVRLLFNDEFVYYVHPGLRPFSWVLFGFILVFAIESIYTVVKRRHFYFPKKTFFLYIPLLLMLGFSSKNLSSQTIASMAADIGSPSVTNSGSSLKSELGMVNDTSTIIAIEDNDFYAKLTAAYGVLQDELIGRDFKIRGEFYSDEEQFNSNQGVVGRLVITCCVPHGQFMGFIVQCEKPNEIKEETWVEASGTLEMIEVKGGTAPVIRIKKWKEVQPGGHLFL